MAAEENKNTVYDETSQAVFDYATTYMLEVPYVYFNDEGQMEEMAFQMGIDGQIQLGN